VIGGARRNRTDDLFNAIEALSQLSYGPTFPARPEPEASGKAFQIVVRQSRKEKRPFGSDRCVANMSATALDIDGTRTLHKPVMRPMREK
jgi:hypothetical protein